MTKTRERPIVLRAWEVRAILAGTKRQLRRPIKPQPAPAGEHGGPLRDIVPSTLINRGDLFDVRHDGDNPRAIRCPLGGPGDELWVRETLHQEYTTVDLRTPNGCLAVYSADGATVERDGEPACYEWERPTLPATSMPRWAARLRLRVTGVGVQRVGDISEADAEAEGVDFLIAGLDGRAYDDFERNWCRFSRQIDAEARVAHPRGAFAAMWDKVYAKDGLEWSESPWAWAVEFEVIGGS